MSEIAIPSVGKQVLAQSILKNYRETILGNCLKETVAIIPPRELHEEIMQFVSEEGMHKLQALGIREEAVFALPCVLYRNPHLLGYYRLLMGISEKQFYSSASGLASFEAMEHDGVIGHQTIEDIKEVCIAINATMDIFLGKVAEDSLKTDLYDLPLMTLGVYTDGVWRNMIGKKAAESVFKTIKNIVKSQNAIVTTDEDKRICFSNNRGDCFEVFPGSDPDISIIEDNSIKKLCIEIKGGQDVANVHNRAGEAEKSHQKATQEGWHEKWTVIYLTGLQRKQQEKLLTESPSTDKWFDVNEVSAEVGNSYEGFKAAIIDRLGLS